MDLVLKKSVYLYEYIDNWQRFNEMFLPGKKKKNYSSLAMEDITNAD